jgi:hypothetical protein
MDELDGLRLHVAILKKNEAIRLANEAIAAHEKAHAEVCAKYQIGAADVVNLDTFEIKRA